MNKRIIPFPIYEQLSLSISFSHTDTSDIIDSIEYSHNAILPSVKNDSIFAKKILNELDCYMNDAKFQFSLACNIQLGTPFQQRVWQSLIKIPSGKVKTYGELAKELNSSARAVGNACRHNPFPVMIPCHRIVSASGIGGYAGDTLDLQKGQINYLQIKQW